MDDSELSTNKNQIELSDNNTKQIDDLENFELETNSKSNANKNKRKEVGRVFKAFYINEEPLIVIGPHWPLFLCLTTTITVAIFLFFYFFSQILNFYVKIFGEINYIIFIFSYFYTSLINPGIPEKDLWIQNISIKNAFQHKKIKNYRICQFCQLIMNLDENTSHCDDCEICVEGNNIIISGYDHHCPWTSKCIGKRNIKTFYLFVGSIICMIFYFLFASISLFI